MSSDFFAVFRSIRGSTLTSNQRLLLITIAEKSDGTLGVCSCKTSTLMSETSMSRATIFRVRDELSALGWLSVESVPGKPALMRVLDGGSHSETGVRQGSHSETGVSPNSPKGSHSETGVGRQGSHSETGVLTEQTTQMSGLVHSPNPLIDGAERNGHRDEGPASATGRHTHVLAELGALARETNPRFKLGPKDLEAIVRALDQGVSPLELEQVWCFFNNPNEKLTSYAREAGWAARWRTLLNGKLDQRLADASTWAGGLPPGVTFRFNNHER